MLYQSKNRQYNITSVQLKQIYLCTNTCKRKQTVTKKKQCKHAFLIHWWGRDKNLFKKKTFFYGVTKGYYV